MKEYCGWKGRDVQLGIIEINAFLMRSKCVFLSGDAYKKRIKRKTDAACFAIAPVGSAPAKPVYWDLEVINDGPPKSHSILPRVFNALWVFFKDAWGLSIIQIIRFFFPPMQSFIYPSL